MSQCCSAGVEDLVHAAYKISKKFKDNIPPSMLMDVLSAQEN